MALGIEKPRQKTYDVFKDQIKDFARRAIANDNSYHTYLNNASKKESRMTQVIHRAKIYLAFTIYLPILAD